MSKARRRVKGGGALRPKLTAASKYARALSFPQAPQPSLRAYPSTG
jgi:hypothetical protein